MNEAETRYVNELKQAHRRELAEHAARTEAQTVRAEIAEWAVRGVAARRITITLDPFQLMAKGTDVLMLAQALGESAAHQLLHASGIAFKEHANYHAALSHIHYLEGHAASSGLAFRAYTPPNPAAVPARYYRPQSHG